MGYSMVLGSYHAFFRHGICLKLCFMDLLDSVKIFYIGILNTSLSLYEYLAVQ